MMQSTDYAHRSINMSKNIVKLNRIKYFSILEDNLNAKTFPSFMEIHFKDFISTVQPIITSLSKINLSFMNLYGKNINLVTAHPYRLCSQLRLKKLCIWVICGCGYSMNCWEEGKYLIQNLVMLSCKFVNNWINRCWVIILIRMWKCWKNWRLNSVLYLIKNDFHKFLLFHCF